MTLAKELANDIWSFLHSMALLANKENKIKEYNELEKSIIFLLPCEECKQHFIKNQKLQEYKQQPNHLAKLNFLHNKVNAVLNKKQFTLEESNAYHQKTAEDISGLFTILLKIILTYIHYWNGNNWNNYNDLNKIKYIRRIVAQSFIIMELDTTTLNSKWVDKFSHIDYDFIYNLLTQPQKRIKNSTQKQKQKPTSNQDPIPSNTTNTISSHPPTHSQPLLTMASFQQPSKQISQLKLENEDKLLKHKLLKEQKAQYIEKYYKNKTFDKQHIKKSPTTNLHSSQLTKTTQLTKKSQTTTQNTPQQKPTPQQQPSPQQKPTQQQQIPNHQIHKFQLQLPKPQQQLLKPQQQQLPKAQQQLPKPQQQPQTQQQTQLPKPPPQPQTQLPKPQPQPQPQLIFKTPEPDTMEQQTQQTQQKQTPTILNPQTNSNIPKGFVHKTGGCGCRRR